MTTLDPLLQVLDLFRHGYDTVTIGQALAMKESEVERMLHTALVEDRKDRANAKRWGDHNA